MYLCTKWSWFRKTKYCIKFYEKADANAGGLDELMDEYVLMASLDNPHIAKTYEVFQDKSFYYLVNEPYFGGDLTKLGKNASQQGVRMGENWWRQIFRQCMDGLCYLHGNGVMHCDIKEPNIMLSKSESYEAPQVVLIDFGLASAFTSNRQGVCGTPGYIPPETWRHGIWYPRGDVFSMGVVFFQCICGMVPSKNGTVQGALVEGCGSHEDLSQAAQSRPLPWSRFPQNIPLLRDLIETMTLRERRSRPVAMVALSHDWFKSSTDAELPSTSLQGLLGCAVGHEVMEELAIRLSEANTLHILRQLQQQFQEQDRRRQGTVESEVAMELLLAHGVPGKIARLCTESSGPHFPYASLMNDLLASKERYGYQYVLELFQSLDVDSSGSLTLEELRGLIGGGVFQLRQAEDVEQLLSWMDTNQDGTVSFGEFLNVALEYGQINTRAEGENTSPSFWAGLGLQGWGTSSTNSAAPARSMASQRVKGSTMAMNSQMPLGGSLADPGSQVSTQAPVDSPPKTWRLRVGIFSASSPGRPEPGFEGAYCTCSLCGEDSGSTAVELFRTATVRFDGQASWNIEEELLDYQPPDGLEFAIVCQGQSERLLGKARLGHRQFFPLGCNTRLTSSRSGGGIQGTLWVKILVMEDDGQLVSEAPLKDPSPAIQKQPGQGRKRTDESNTGTSVTWGRSWVEDRPPVLAGFRSRQLPPAPAQWVPHPHALDPGAWAPVYSPSMLVAMPGMPMRAASPTTGYACPQPGVNVPVGPQIRTA